MTLRILLADDHDIVRQGIRSILETETGIEICCEASNGREAVKLAAELRPDIVILDVSMPELNGLEAARQILQQNPRTEVLVFTMHKTENLFQEALRAGAKGFVLKSDGVKVLLRAVKALAAHNPYFSNSLSGFILTDYLEKLKSDAETQPHLLTGREREIVQLIAEGKSTKEIAAEISISPKTVETHRANIMRKLSLNSLAELVRYAVRNRLIEP